LGKLTSDLQINTKYETETGIIGVVRIFKTNSHIRLNWKP